MPWQDIAHSTYIGKLIGVRLGLHSVAELNVGAVVAVLSKQHWFCSSGAPLAVTTFVVVIKVCLRCQAIWSTIELEGAVHAGRQMLRIPSH